MCSYIYGRRKPKNKLGVHEKAEKIWKFLLKEPKISLCTYSLLETKQLTFTISKLREGPENLFEIEIRVKV